jgi:hypothetical protein
VDRQQERVKREEKEQTPSHFKETCQTKPTYSINPSISLANFNLGEDLDGNLDRSISTTDLVSWSLQIARGNDYLVSKKVLSNKYLYLHLP